MRTRRLRQTLPLSVLLLASACATVQPPQRTHLHDPDEQLQSCARWFQALDSAVEAAQVRDGAAAAVAGFPYLRVDRYSASLAMLAARDRAAFEQWVGRMRALDQEARSAEAANLPPAALHKLGVTDSAGVLQRSTECGQRLLAADLAEPASEALLAPRALAPDHYLGWRRVVGLYPFVSYPFFSGVKGWQRDAQEVFRKARAGEPPAAAVSRYVPPAAPGYSRKEVAALLARAAADPLGIPRVSAEERERLFATFAPVIEVETTGDYDRPGALQWTGQRTPSVDVSRPVVYRKLAYTRYHGGTLLQLVYTLWFSERPKSGAFDLLGGRLDGIVWRVTLAADGEPVLFDSIHPCGCFQMFFPTPRAQPIAPPQEMLEWAFVPVDAPALPDGSRIKLQAQTRTHYLRDIAIDGGQAGSRYAFADYDELRTLPVPADGTRSAFAPDGLIPGSSRAERYLFWPMGIASAGAMREWGTHATAFVGRRHFDDADLIERRFVIN